MSLVAIGLNHRTVPLEVLEKMTVPESRLPKALADVHSRENISEAVVLSTCNRTEVYVYAERFHGAFQNVRDFLAEVAFLPPEEFSDYLYTFYDSDAVAHLFSVTSGLDSAVLGESEIQGQVKVAWEAAQAEGAVGSALNAVFRHALEVGKRVRTETRISRSITSVSTAAVAMAADRLGGLIDRSIIVLGAGEMGGGMAAAVGDIDAADVTVVSRTWDRAANLADRIGGRAVHLDELTAALTGADVLVHLHGLGVADARVRRNCVDHGRAGWSRTRGRRHCSASRRRPRCGGTRRCRPTRHERRAQLRRLGAPRTSSRDRHRSSHHHGRGRPLRGREFPRVAAPLIADLRSHASVITESELERFGTRLEELDPDQRAAVEGLVNGVVNKLLHEPSVRLKEAADSPHGDRLAEALRDLFGL